MMRTDVFFDANVVLYLFATEVDKAEQSDRLIRAGGLISVQVLDEVALVARRKMRKAWPEVHEMMAGIRAKCAVIPLTLAVHERGLAYAERYGLHIFDALIVAAALTAGCTTLYSEDMHDGLALDGLTISNPYA